MTPQVIHRLQLPARVIHAARGVALVTGWRRCTAGKQGPLGRLRTGLAWVGVAAGLGACAPSPADQSGADLFAGRCASCHGTTGAGDGPAAAAQNPKPRDLRPAVWQDAVNDDYLSRVIVGGGAAVQKTATMPPQPDLAEHPEALARLVAHVRTLRAPAPPTAAK